MQKFISRFKSQGFPVLTTTSILTGLFIYNAGTPNIVDPRTSISSYFMRAFNSLCDSIRLPNKIVLPPNKTEKPVLLFDIENIIVKHNLNPFQFNFLVYKRSYADVFLFHLAHLYEIIAFSEYSDNEFTFSQIDPYGCISYRLYLPNKKAFDLNCLNRNTEKLICLTTNEKELNSDFDKNSLRLEPWDGKEDKKMLNLCDFLTNLHFCESEKWTKIIGSYKNKNWEESWNAVRKKLFKKRNFLSVFRNENYEKRIEMLNNERINEFQKAKVFMDESVGKEKLMQSRIGFREIIDKALRFFMF